MKYVETGYGKIPYLSLLAILSISLVVNLPGLAISPIMGKLNQVFKDVTELEIQLLTVLPNLVTIPFRCTYWVSVLEYILSQVSFIFSHPL